MKIEVLLFGRPREIVGASRKIVSLEKGSKLDDLLDLLARKYGAGVSNELKRTDTLIVMINGRHFGTIGGVEAPLNDKDTVAIMPAVVGG